MDTVSEDSSFQAPTDPVQTPSSSRHNTASSGSGDSNGPTFIRTVLLAPDVTFEEKKRSRSARSSASNDSGYYSDTAASKASRSSSTTTNSRDDILALVQEAPYKRLQKQPTTFQCSFCPIKFTRAYNLRSHSRTHTDERPFACTICGKAFACQHECKRCEGLHSNESEFDCRGELHLQPGLHWGCGRRFARADALGRHLRSEAGRYCIKPLFDEEASESFVKQQENNHPAGFCKKIGLDSERAGAFTLPAALLSKYPALQNIDWSQIPSGEEVEEGYPLFRSIFDIGYEPSGEEVEEGYAPLRSIFDIGFESTHFLSLYEPLPLPPIRMNAEVGGQVPSVQHLCSNNSGQLCKTETNDSPTDVEPACKQLSSPKPSSCSSTGVHETVESEASPSYQPRVVSTDYEVVGAWADKEVFNYYYKMEEAHAELHVEKAQSTHLDDITKLIETPRTDDKNIAEDAAGLDANFHNSRVSSRVTSALPCSLKLPVDLVFETYQHPHNVPDSSGAAHAEADCDPNPMPAGRNADNELGDDSFSLPSEDHQTEVVSLQSEANQDEEDGKFSDEEAKPLLPDKSSPNSDSENGYESTSERSVLNYSQKALVSRLMDEICSSFLFQVCHRPRQHGRRAAESFSSDSTKASINTIDFNNNGSSVGRAKRARKGDEDPEGEDDGQKKRRRSKESVSSDSPLAEVRYFACPFHKFDVSTYSNRNENPRLALKYRSCGPPGWATIGKMK